MDNSALQFLRGGQTITQNYLVTINDGRGGSDTEVVTVEVAWPE